MKKLLYVDLRSPFLDNCRYPVGGAEVLLVMPLEHERAWGATTP